MLLPMSFTSQYPPQLSWHEKKTLYVPLDFKKGLTKDGLVDSGAYVIAIAQSALDRIKQQAPSNILKIDDPPIFQI